ncbi:MAG TPA: DinB family protein [Pyrinomonadaceae bacterium]|nr:DinB family protein [Pyrinomonadaceae bacterium]
MMYNSVAQIFEEIDATRERLSQRVEGLSEEQALARPGADAWTVKEIMEHLAIIENRLLSMMKMMLAKVEGAAAAAGGGGPVKMKPFTLDHHIERSLREKYNAPEAVRPSGTVSLADSLANLARSREELRSLRPRIEATSLSVATYPHPAFGPLDFYEWLAFVGHHEARHLRQIESMLSS